MSGGRSTQPIHLEIIRLRVEEGLFPGEIAERVGKNRKAVNAFLATRGLGLTEEEKAGARYQAYVSRWHTRAMRNHVARVTGEPTQIEQYEALRAKGYSRGLAIQKLKIKLRQAYTY